MAISEYACGMAISEYACLFCICAQHARQYAQGYSSDRRYPDLPGNDKHVCDPHPWPKNGTFLLLVGHDSSS
jgi:hypothetical protein